jgi:hypothetical protein
MKNNIRAKIFLSLICLYSHCYLYSTNNLIMILDENKVETLYNTSRANVITALNALYCATAPILVSTNVFEIIVSLQNMVGVEGLQQMRSVMKQVANEDEAIAKMYTR